MKNFEYIITDELGIHARPAGLLAKEARKYKSQILINANGKSVEVTRLMAVMSLAIKCGHTVQLEITGEDEAAACEGMKTFFEDNL